MRLRALLPRGHNLDSEWAASRIKWIAQTTREELEARPDLLGALPQVRKTGEALNAAAAATRKAHTLLMALEQPAWEEFFDRAPAEDIEALRSDAASDRFYGKPGRPFTPTYFDRLVMTLERAASLCDAMAKTAGDEGFLASLKRKGPTAAVQRNHLRRCANLLEELKATVRIKRSEDGPFHQFVIAVGNLAGLPDVTRRQLHDAVHLFETAKLHEP